MNISPATIVVVEDDGDTAEFLCDFFAMQGIIVVTCPPGGDARTYVAESGAKAVILDLYLDGKRGVDVLYQLRGTPTTQMTPIVFFSGSQEKLQKLLPDYAEHGAFFVPKPDIVQLKEIIERLVQQSA